MFAPLGHNLNTCGRGSLDGVTDVSDKKIFVCFPHISLCNTRGQQDRPLLVPGASSDRDCLVMGNLTLNILNKNTFKGEHSLLTRQPQLRVLSRLQEDF